MLCSLETIRDLAWLASLAGATPSEDNTLWVDALEWAVEQRMRGDERTEVLAPQAVELN